MPKYSSRDMQRLAGSVPSIEQRMGKAKAAEFAEKGRAKIDELKAKKDEKEA